MEFPLRNNTGENRQAPRDFVFLSKNETSFDGVRSGKHLVGVAQYTRLYDAVLGKAKIMFLPQTYRSREDVQPVTGHYFQSD